MTLDRDHGELLFRHAHRPPPGVVYFRLRPMTPSGPAERLLNVLADTSTEIEGMFTVIDRTSTRQRPLPQS
jgi:hypothetical protein